MCSKEVIVANVADRYENPIAELVQIACQFSSSLYLVNDEHHINAKSMMGIMAFNPSEGMKVEIESEGTDEEDAMNAMEEFLLCH